MNKFILALSIVTLTSVFSLAQTADEFKKVEFFAGYSNGQVDSVTTLQGERENFNGFNVAGVYNVNRYFGVRGDFSATFNSNRFTAEIDVGGTPGTFSVKNSNSLYNFLGGVQVKDNSKSGRFKPFAHALVGGAHLRTKVSDITCSPATACGLTTFPDDTISDTGFAGAFGGGIDARDHGASGGSFAERAVDQRADRCSSRSGAHGLRVG
ncbi:MAG: outer membrane beta-barrel protein, partial [Acidobacteria bacterium]|nr:outer membrane beta-barrel protein [Acidobacteriota bacterium]